MRIIAGCLVAECIGKHKARGLCAYHYDQWHSNKLEIEVLPKLVRQPCMTIGCDKLSDCKGMCEKHYRQRRREEGLDRAANQRYLKKYFRKDIGKYSCLKRAARNLGLGLDITKEQHKELRSKCCHYCGGVLNDTGHGLDRKDTTKGYFLENVVPCCYPCNKIKNDVLSYKEMVIAMKAVLEYRATKGESCGS